MRTQSDDDAGYKYSNQTARVKFLQWSNICIRKREEAPRCNISACVASRQTRAHPDLWLNLLCAIWCVGLMQREAWCTCRCSCHRSLTPCSVMCCTQQGKFTRQRLGLISAPELWKSANTYPNFFLDEALTADGDGQYVFQYSLTRFFFRTMRELINVEWYLGAWNASKLLSCWLSSLGYFRCSEFNLEIFLTAH